MTAWVHLLYDHETIIEPTIVDQRTTNFTFPQVILYFIRINQCGVGVVREKPEENDGVLRLNQSQFQHLIAFIVSILINQIK